MGEASAPLAPFLVAPLAPYFKCSDAGTAPPLLFLYPRLYVDSKTCTNSAKLFFALEKLK